MRATTEPGTHLTIDARINSIAATTLVDSGATGVFMHHDFARHCGAEMRPKLIPWEVRIIDGRVINSSLITHEATFQLTMGGHHEIIVADHTNTGRYHCILGTPWLVQHSPTIRWSWNQVIFYSDYCKRHCLQSTLPVLGSTVN